ncbi:hypothetical protein GCM10007881_15600 [Mesorhizobium huakuii]|nr:hypothetical protein GCM10007881_15600 [Mesorhizobium huakuii]
MPDVNQLPEPDPFQVSEAPSARDELDMSSPASPSASEAHRPAIGRLSIPSLPPRLAGRLSDPRNIPSGAPAGGPPKR